MDGMCTASTGASTTLEGRDMIVGEWNGWNKIAEVDSLHLEVG